MLGSSGRRLFGIRSGIQSADPGIVLGEYRGYCEDAWQSIIKPNGGDVKPYRGISIFELHAEYDADSDKRCGECGHFKPHWRHDKKKAKTHYHPFDPMPPDENVGRPLPAPADTASGEERGDTPGAERGVSARLPPASTSGGLNQKPSRTEGAP